MKQARVLMLVSLLFATLFTAGAARAQSTEERFQDLFVTAGYSTAFGAAMGAACLSFLPDPAANLRYIAVGASLGFIGGSILGTYIIFSPLLMADQSAVNQTWAMERRPPDRGGLLIQPTFLESGRLARLDGAITLARF